ncbi:unnamed protein product [Oikopleura dioica]|uniref:RNase NYN domain-containing protein n=1 Tax=Oikopleura dioica TaxID=34765 RepID=E4YI46_OIKDI|nr:unnamed protein product [Oikopleura dioica]
MVYVTAKIFRELCERREDINNYYGVSLLHQKQNNGFAIDPVPEKNKATDESIAKATTFLAAFALEKSNQCDRVPFSSILKPLFKDVLGGHLRNIIEMENNVRLDELDSQSHHITIYGDEDGRLEVISQFITIHEILSGEHLPDGDDAQINETIESIFRDTKESTQNKRDFCALHYGVKRYLFNLRYLQKINIPRIRAANIQRGETSQKTMAPVPSATPPRIKNAFLSSFTAQGSRSPTPPAVISLLDDCEESHPRASAAQINPEDLGAKLIRDVKERFPDWNREDAEMEWFKYMEECNISNRPVNYNEAMERVKSVAAPPAEPPFDGSVNEAIGQQVIKEISDRHRSWDNVKAQMEMLQIIEEYNKRSERIDVNDAMRRIEAIANDIDFKDIEMEADDEPPETMGIDADVIEVWFQENYEDTPAYNMAVYKSDLFKEFTSHFELYYSGDNHEKHYQNFIGVIHALLLKKKHVYPNVKTKGNTGVNARKRFAHLRRKGTKTELQVEVRSPKTEENSIPGWTNLAAVVNPRIAPILVEQSFRTVQKAKKAESNPDKYTLRCPWNERFSNLYPGGVDGDPTLRRIVIDGSNIARSHGKVGEIRRQHKCEVFSIIGIKITVEHFWNLGCRSVTVFLPHNRQGNKGMPRIPEKERKLQEQMETEDIIKYTPGRYHKGTKQFIQAYDDRYILDMAKAEDGIVISNDHFRDLYDEFKDVINWRLLP